MNTVDFVKEVQNKTDLGRLFQKVVGNRRVEKVFTDVGALRRARVELCINGVSFPLGEAMHAMTEDRRKAIAAGLALAKIYGTRSGRPIGRPRVDVPLDEVKALRAQGASWVEVEVKMGISRRTAWRRVMGRR